MKGFDAIASESFLIDYGVEKKEVDDKIIKLFNLFLSSNSDYLYNKTYITDLIPKFIKKLEVLKNKKNECCKIGDKLKENNNTNFFILADNYYIILPMYGTNVISYNELCSMISTDSKGVNILQKIKKDINSYIEPLDIYNIDEKKIHLRIFYKEDNFVYIINRKLGTKDIEILSEEIDIFIKECSAYER
ncbi:hypothetical protein [Clostridium sp. 1001271B_151109_B4]|uniref:hypothetical protein n=1 Tax=Clostridium sp. 1001271B_151109_B4 TaxID=2787148 RepID=UPI0018AA3A95|nr:hypothetical protein [Clostridium sp. 1001271B_151109_B4]